MEEIITAEPAEVIQPPAFTHLHVHTQYSFLDGAASIPGLIDRALALGMQALAITDHGAMYGVLEFFQEARAAGLKPILGIETYVARNGRFSKQGKPDRSGYHLILLAKNLQGYRNLCRLSSLAFLEGFYYTPRIDKELLRLHHEGLIACSACLGGEIPKTLANHGMNAAEEALKEYLDIFGDDFYLELQRHGLQEQQAVNAGLLELSEKYGVKIIATNDVHFITAENREAHDILIRLNTNRDEEDGGLVYSGQEYLKSPEQMAELFSDLPQAIANTQEITGKIEDFNIQHKVMLPDFPVPDGFNSGIDYLRHLTYEGARQLYAEITPEIEQRIEFELDVISSKHFEGYFLIVADFIREARNMGVLVGPGRGSAAGSVIAYCTGITTIDPIHYKLLFERFLNPDRESMPDIDVDFDDAGREKVLRYVTQKYGESRVSQIITFGTMAARMSIRDVARILQLPLPEADKLAKMIDTGQDLKTALKKNRELIEVFERGSQTMKKTLELAQVLEGSVRQMGTHACGVIIGPDDLINHIPLTISKDTGQVITQFEGKLMEDAGMLKMDFLGLKTLSIIKSAIENIRIRHDIMIDTETIPLDDPLTLEMFQKGDTVGIFQFESDGMRAYLKRLKPSSIEDLIAMNALYRPGPLDMIPQFINRKQGREKVEYPHPLLEDILKPTYGIMVYQEQIMQAAQILAGFTPGKADDLRKAMGKKIASKMEEKKGEFLEGALVKGIEREKALKIFGFMEEFAKYGFNRSHSAAYAILAFRTAYLKTHYPAEFMAAILTHNLSDITELTFFADECKRQGIAVLGPDVNESMLEFSVNRKGEIRFGLAAIKGLGEGAVENIIEERKANGPYDGLFDFIRRINLRTVNKKSLEAMAMAGVFDNFPGIHGAMFFHREGHEETTFLDKLIRFANAQAANTQAAQQQLFEETTIRQTFELALPKCEAWSYLEKLKFEKEVTGFYMTGHPLEAFAIEMKHFCNLTLDQLKSNLQHYRNKEVRFAGIITLASHKTAKNGKPYGNITFEDIHDSFSMTMFSEDYLKVKHLLQEGNYVFVRARIEPRFNNPDQYEPRIVAMHLLAETLDKMVRETTIIIDSQEVNEAFVDELKQILLGHPGTARLKIQVTDSMDDLSVSFTSRIKVNSAELSRKLEKMKALQYKFN
ncbi:MAG TPA: DNA polymerase III subunit alpha [Bacteroidales bacterium]|nr:DNA polymerase III subunit alpha [Bacteroidales bacterium]HSA43646.1 DNA polymerase III subunit alpha [Bacteroidales bacterium]